MRFLDPYRGAGLPRTVKALGLTSFLQDVASEMVYPLLPAFLLSLGGGPLALGAMESVAEGVLALVKGAAGRWSDRLRRRKPFVVSGYGLSALTRPLLALVLAPGHVVALRAADRLAKGLRTAPRDAMIAEAASAGQRAFAFSFHRGLDHLGAAVGPLVAALWLLAAPGQLRQVFALATIPAVLGWASVGWGTRETAPGKIAATGAAAGALDANAREVRPGAPSPFARHRLALPLAAFFLFSLGNASDAFLLLAAAQHGYSPTGLTLLWSGFHAVKWLASAPAGRLADRTRPGWPLLAGWCLYALVYVGFAVAEDRGSLALLFVVYAAYYGLTEGAERALVVELAGTRLGAGSSLGAFHLTTGLGVFAASLIFGLLWEAVSPQAAFLTGAALALAAGLLMASTLRRQ